MREPKPKRAPRQTTLQDAEPLSARPSYRCSKSELGAACKEARRRGMTFSQLARLAVNGEIKRGGK